VPKETSSPPCGVGALAPHQEVGLRGQVEKTGAASEAEEGATEVRRRDVSTARHVPKFGRSPGLRSAHAGSAAGRKWTGDDAFIFAVAVAVLAAIAVVSLG